jgi:hypothetical protein
MGTTVIEGQLVLKVPVEILGPGSEYEQRYLALKGEIERLILEASKIKQVTTPEELEFANNAGRVLQASGKEVETFYKPLKQQVDAFKAPLLMHEKGFAGPLDTEKRRLGELITTYNAEVERKRLAAERVAREQAEAEARKAAEDAALAEAALLEAVGDTEGAEELLNQPIVVDVAPVVIQQEAPVKMAGQVGKITYKCIVTDAKALLKAVANGQAPMQCFSLDQGWLDKKAALDKDGFSLPGCRLDKQSSTHFRA